MPVSPGVTVTGTFKDLQNNAIASLQVGFTLQPTTLSYQGAWEITGVGILPYPPTAVYAVTDATGHFSITLWGNDQFSQPTSSFYAVQAGKFAFEYQFLNGNSYDLLTATPINPTPAAAVPASAQNANLIYAGPTSGGAAIPTFRGMVSGDLPANVVPKQFDNVQIVDSTLQRGGSDIGDETNKAYAALPASGGTIWVMPTSGGTCYNFSTPIAFTTKGKYVVLQSLAPAIPASGALTGACLNYTPTTATSAITMDYEDGTLTNPPPQHGLRDITLVNNQCIATGGCGSSATGIAVGNTNAGIQNATMEYVSIYGFGTGYLNTNLGSSDVRWFHSLFQANVVAKKIGSIGDFGNGETFSGNGQVFLAATSTTPELHWENMTIFGNTVLPVLDFTAVGATPANFYCSLCHFENGASTSQDIKYIAGSVDVQIVGGVMESDSTVGGPSSWFISCSGSSLTIDGTIFKSPINVTQAVLMNSPCRAVIKAVNYNPSTIPAAFVGGANAAFATVLNSAGPSTNVAQTWKFESSLTSSAFISGSTNPSATGVVRLANGDRIAFRNHANSGDLPILAAATDAFNVLGFPGGILSAIYTTNAANPSITGVFQLGSGDTISWRNNANSADLAFGKNTTDQFTIPTAFAAIGTQAGLTGTGACATITTQKGGAWAGQATCTGTTGASTFIIAPGTTAPNGWVCYASDITTSNALRQSVVGTASCTIAGTVNQNDVLTFIAVAY